ncbi:MAG: helix-turn-helix domain-containing protein [Bacteroidetes bacterium]|nr:helix-turn-helix domain-containing protein [Bacteroidota bacterium]
MNILLVAGHSKDRELLSPAQESSCILLAGDENAMANIIRTRPVHLIVIDLDLIQVDCLALCARLKASSCYGHIPVLLLGADTTTDRINGLQAGADACMSRPFSPKHLKAQVQNLLSNRARIRQYYTHAADSSDDDLFRQDPPEKMLEKVNHFICAHLSDPTLGVGSLAKKMNMSRPTLYRKIKSISDHTPNELINVARLNRAAELISTRDYRILEIARMVGFSSRSNFGKAFFKQFNVTPTAYQQLMKGA